MIGKKVETSRRLSPPHICPSSHFPSVHHPASSSSSVLSPWPVHLTCQMLLWFCSPRSLLPLSSILIKNCDFIDLLRVPPQVYSRPATELCNPRDYPKVSFCLVPLTLPWYPVAFSIKSELLPTAYPYLPSFEQALSLFPGSLPTPFA